MSYYHFFLNNYQIVRIAIFTKVRITHLIKTQLKAEFKPKKGNELNENDGNISGYIKLTSVLGQFLDFVFHRDMLEMKWNKLYQVRGGGPLERSPEIGKFATDNRFYLLGVYSLGEEAELKEISGQKLWKKSNCRFY